MTVDLDMMLDLRDAQVAADVARKAELGWFDVEFTMYECAYMEGGKRWYRLSERAETIYDFVEAQCGGEGLVPRVMLLSEKYPVPVGMKESVAVDVKKALGKRLQEAYAEEFFVYLQEVAERCAEDSGYEYLLAEREFSKEARKTLEMYGYRWGVLWR